MRRPRRQHPTPHEEGVSVREKLRRGTQQREEEQARRRAERQAAREQEARKRKEMAETERTDDTSDGLWNEPAAVALMHMVTKESGTATSSSSPTGAGEPHQVVERARPGTPESPQRSPKRRRVVTDVMSSPQVFGNPRMASELARQPAMVFGMARGNALNHFRERELGARANWCQRTNASIRYANLQLHKLMDSNAVTGPGEVIAYIDQRSGIAEITSLGSYVVALTKTGLCTVWDRKSDDRVWCINNTADEVIRSVFLNKLSESVLTVSVHRSNNFKSLCVRSTPLEYLKRGDAKRGFAVFGNENLSYPGFVEFDDTNGVALTFCSVRRVYKVWDMRDYRMLFEMEERGVAEIKICPHFLLVVHQRSQASLPLSMMEVRTGKVTNTTHVLLHRTKPVEFVELFNERLLLKQPEEDLRIIDLVKGGETRVAASAFATPKAFIFLHHSQMMLCFHATRMQLWDHRGRLVSQFDQQFLWNSKPNSNCFVNERQDVLFSFNRELGYLYVCDLHNGKVLQEVKLHSQEDIAAAEQHGDEALHHTLRAHNHALTTTTEIHYNEDLHEIYTGSEDGLFAIWTPGGV